MTPELSTWLIPVISFAAVFGGLRVALNGTSKKVDEIHRTIHDKDIGNAVLGARVTRLEDAE